MLIIRSFCSTNANSTKEFSSSSKPPPSIENPFVHLENGCLCSAGKIDDTAEKSDTDEDEHEASRAGDNVCRNLDPETWKPVPGSRRPRFRR